jgi:L-amino acid N-acyltransferase YncA
MTNRNEYSLKLSEYRRTDASLNDAVLRIRPVQAADTLLLAELMIDAYRGTIDYDDETFDDGLAEVNAFIVGERGGPPWLAMSYLALVDSHVVGACLTGEWSERQLPVIAYVLTSANWKKQGVGRQLLFRVLDALNENSYPEVRAVITEGNTPSENLFLKIGFQRVVAP